MTNRFFPSFLVTVKGGNLYLESDLSIKLHVRFLLIYWSCASFESLEAGYILQLIVSGANGFSLI